MKKLIFQILTGVYFIMHYSSLYNQFKAVLQPILSDADKIAVAVSGGADSMALVLLMHEYAQEMGREIVALTVDHGIRPESFAEAGQVGLWLAKYGIAHHIIKWQGQKTATNLQMKARKARYELMADYCSENNIKFLATGHNLNDQAETVLMRLLRGSGVDGLAGMVLVKQIFDINVIRPLLSITHQNLQQFLRAKNQLWIEDPSNENVKFQRVAVRKLIQSFDDPQLLTKRLVDTAAHMARAKDYISGQLAKNINEIVTYNEAGFYEIKLTEFKSLHQEERYRVLAAALQKISGNVYRPRFENLQLLDIKINNGQMINSCTLYGCVIAQGKRKIDSNILYIYRELAAISPPLEVQANTEIIWDGRFLCQVGDIKPEALQIGALGASGYQQIYKSDKNLLQHIKLPKKIIYTMPTLFTLEKPLATPHIGYLEAGFRVLGYRGQGGRV